MRSLSRRIFVPVLAVLFMLSVLMGSVFAQTPKHHLNFVQKHPVLTGVAAGVVTHHMLKVKAAHDKAMGKKLNWAERHPTLTAIGAGVATHHIIKHFTPKN